MKIRIAHFADPHIDETNFEQTLPALEFIVSWVEKERPDYVVFAGDLGIKRGHMTPTVSWQTHRLFLRIAEVCPLIMIPGNHDISNSYDKVDTVMGLFGLGESPGAILGGPTYEAIHENIRVCPRPEAFQIMCLEGPMQFIALPFPSRYIYLSQEDNLSSPQVINAEIGRRLELVLAGLAAELDPTIPSMLIMHGLTEGGIAGSEMSMTTAEEIAIRRSAIPGNIDAVAAGHLHEAQEVGRVVYSGAPCPHTFGQEAQHPSFVVWSIDPDKRDVNGHSETTFERIPIPVAHPLFTINLEDMTYFVAPITDRILDHIVSFPETLIGARVRILGSIPESRRVELDKARIEQALYDRGAIEARVLIETVSDMTVRADHISMEMSTDTLFNLWCDLHTESEPLRADLKCLAREIDTEFPPEERALLRGSSFKPIRLSWHNWKQHADGELLFDTLGRLTCITGPNTSGKSNVAEAEPFVLWKALIRGTTSLKEAIRWGETECFVGEELELNNDRYRIVRSVSIGRGDKVKSDLVVTRLEGDSWIPVNWGDQRETQRKLEELVGSLDMYLATRFGSQFDIDRLLNLKPAELKDLLQEALNARIFDIRRETARKKLNSKELELVTVRSEIRRLEGIVSGKDELEEKLKDAQAILREAMRDIEIRKVALDELVARRADIRGRVAAVETEIERFTELETRVTHATQARRSCERSIGIFEKTLADSQTIREKVAELKKLREQEKELRPKKEYVAHLEGELHKLEKEIQGRIAELAGKIQTADSNLSVAKKKAALLDDPKLNCPIEGGGSCKFLVDAVHAKGQIPDLQAGLAHWNRQAEITKGKDENAVKEARAIIDIARRMAAGLEKIYSEIEVLERGGWEDKAQKIDRVEAQIDGERKALKNVIAEQETLANQLITMGERPSKDALTAELASLEKPISGLERTIKGLEASRDDSNVEIGEIKARLTGCREAHEKRKELASEETALTGAIGLLSEYVRATSRDGLPFLLLEKALPTLQAYTNEFLGPGTDGQFLRVKIDPLRDLVTGEQRNEPVITFDDENGTHSLTEAGGAQRTRLGYSLRSALARIQAETIGCEVKVAYMDEGWGVFDDSNIVSAQAMLRRFADVFSRVIFITHVSEVKQIADTIITVIPDPKNGSRLEVS